MNTNDGQLPTGDDEGWAAGIAAPGLGFTGDGIELSLKQDAIGGSIAVAERQQVEI